jgi:hypothetical protein
LRRNPRERILQVADEAFHLDRPHGRAAAQGEPEVPVVRAVEIAQERTRAGGTMSTSSV